MTFLSGTRAPIESIDPSLGNDFPWTPYPFDRRPTLLFEPGSELVNAARNNNWVVQVLIEGTPGGKYDGYAWGRLVSTMKRPLYYAANGGRKYMLKLYKVWRGYPSPGRSLGSVRLVKGASVPESVRPSSTMPSYGTSSLVYESGDAFVPAWVPAANFDTYPALA